MPQRPRGALVLSEFTGAAAELRQAYLANPHDLDGVKNAIESALNQTPKRAGDGCARCAGRCWPTTWTAGPEPSSTPWPNRTDSDRRDVVDQPLPVDLLVVDP